MSSSLQKASGPAFAGPDRGDGGGSGKNGRRSRKKGVSPFTVIGILLLLAGLSCLGWVGYQYFGTNVVSQREFQTQKQELRTKWDSENKTSSAKKEQKNSSDSKKKSSSDTKKKSSSTSSALPGTAMALLRIPAFGSGYEIPILSGTGLDVLAKGVGHYPSTAQPGQIGNLAIAGHRVTHGQPFSRLLELNKGDKVVVETQAAVYTYVLDEAPRQLTVKETDTWVVDPVPGQPNATPSQALITLTTCQDLFHSPDRSIGFGHLESTKNK